MKVEVVQANAEPLLVGRVDFFTGWVTNQPYLIEQEIAKPDALPRLRGKTWKAMRYADYGIRSYSDVIFATGKTIRENPDLVRRYMRALARGMQYILDNPDETVQMVASFPEQVEKADKLAWRWKIQNAAVHQRGHQEERPALDEPAGLGRDDGLLQGVRSDPARRPGRRDDDQRVQPRHQALTGRRPRRPADVRPRRRPGGRPIGA